MTAKKWVTIVTFICSLVAIILMSGFKYCCAEGNIGYDITLAIFGSALLGFIMSLIEYFELAYHIFKRALLRLRRHIREL